MNLTLKIWHQNGPDDHGAMHEYQVKGISEGSSFLEVPDILNEDLFARGKGPIAFDSGCREGICGQCGTVINGIAHSPEVTATCQLHMRTFHDGDIITVESWRADAFPLIKDLVVSRSALDRIIQAGGYISVSTGAASDTHTTPVPKQDADHAFEATVCIGCGACVAACPNASAMSLTSTKVTHLQLLPQSKLENYKRVVNMLNQMDEESFGTYSNTGECTAVCSKQIPPNVIATLNRQLGKAALKGI